MATAKKQVRAARHVARRVTRVRDNSEAERRLDEGAGLSSEAVTE
jgi:hypothetical protein